MSAPQVLFAILILVAFAAVAIGTGIVRRYSLRNEVLDVPNARSSHTVPTPRGGGLSIAIAAVAIEVMLAASGGLPVDIALALAGGGLLVSVTGWIDDHRELAAGWRAVVQFAAAFWALYWLGGFPTLDVGVVTLRLGWLGIPLAALGIVWLTNLYNFMDGTDAFAGVQGLCGGLAGAAVLFAGGAPGLGTVSLTLAAASAGFLVWNWPPARIFMGDVGSYLLGFSFAVLALAGEHAGAYPAFGWSILLGVFVWDATFTLARRVLRGEKWYSAHRAHAYQRIVQLGWSHRRLAGWAVLANVLVLWPLGWLVHLQRATLPAGALAACLLMLAFWLSVMRAHAKRGTMP